jgi:hypothetical protein
VRFRFAFHTNSSFTQHRDFQKALASKRLLPSIDKLVAWFELAATGTFSTAKENPEVLTTTAIYQALKKKREGLFENSLKDYSACTYAPDGSFVKKTSLKSRSDNPLGIDLLTIIIKAMKLTYSKLLLGATALSASIQRLKVGRSMY